MCTVNNYLVEYRGHSSYLLHPKYCDQCFIMWPSLLLLCYILWLTLSPSAVFRGSCILSIVTKISVTNIITLTILPCNAIYCDQHYYCDYQKPRYCDQYCPHQLCAGQGSTAETRGLAGNLAPATAATQLHCYSCSLVTLSAGLTSAQHTLSFCQLVELYLGEMCKCALL